MAEKSITIKQVLGRLSAEALVDEAGLNKIASFLREQQKRVADPLYIRLLSGFGAWLSAPFLFAFLVLIHVIGKTPQSLVAAGVLSLVAAVIISRISRNTFLTQLALALSFAGHLLILSSLDRQLNFNKFAVLAETQIVLCVLIYPFFKNTVYRFAMPFLAIALGLAWVYTSKHYEVLNLLVALQMLAGGGLLLWDKKPDALKPLQYVFATGLLATILLLNFLNAFILAPFDQPRLPDWPSGAVLAGGLIFVLLKLGGWLKSLKEEWMIMAIVVTVLLGAFSAPGIPAAICLLVLGYGLGDKILTSVAFIFLPVFLILFYYALDVSLLNKSYILAGSGLVLLVARWVLKQRPWAKELHE